MILDRYILEKRSINNGGKSIEFYALIDTTQKDTYTTASPNLMPKVITMLEEVFRDKLFIPKYGILGLKMYDLFDYRKHLKKATEELKREYPRTKYINPREYNALLKERARIVALNIEIREQLKEAEEENKIQVYFRKDSPILKLYRKIYGKSRINITEMTERK